MEEGALAMPDRSGYDNKVFVCCVHIRHLEPWLCCQPAAQGLMESLRSYFLWLTMGKSF